MTKMTTIPENYNNIRAGIVELLKTARSATARNVNSIMTAAYWDIGRRIVKFEQGGQHRAEYGEQLIEQLSADLTRQFGRGFGRANLWQMRAFYRAWPEAKILQTLSGESTSSIDPNNINADSSQFWLLRLASRCLGPPTCGCFPSRIRKRGHSTRPKRCVRVGPSANLTAKSAVNSTNASHSRKTKPPCWRKQRTPNPAIW